MKKDSSSKNFRCKNIWIADESKKEEEEGVLEEIANPVEPEMPSEAIQIVFVSMWYWWQEIVLISLVTAAVMNLLITRPYIQGMREGFRRRIDQITRGRPVRFFMTIIHSGFVCIGTMGSWESMSFWTMGSWKVF